MEREKEKAIAWLKNRGFAEWLNNIVKKEKK